MDKFSRACLESTTLYCCYHLNCDNTYTTKFNLKHHIETIHLKVKKFECTVCKKNLSSKQNLREHMHIHNGVKPFVCENCGKSYRQASQLTLHKRIHIKEGNIEIVQNNGITKIHIPDLIYNNPGKLNWEKIETELPILPLLKMGNNQGTISLPSFANLFKVNIK
mmetsp:Transcript_32564/g.32290  ORF Transcript_32564/g.32290 Transcript_32564/m.32290 type:complete len:165 (+) Transcript_32564:7-501(+)